MLKSILKTSIYIACLAGYSIASAAGLGGINVTSSLGQPLKAEIDVVSVDKADKASLRAGLASADAYKDAGIDYPYNIPKLKFKLEDRANGDQYIKVTSIQPVNEPFVTLMVELSWASGKLLREYTFLLDPVGYKPEQPKPENLAPIEPVLAVPTVSPVPEVLAASEPVAAESETEQAAAPEAATAAAPVAESAVAATSGIPVAESAVVATAAASSVAETASTGEAPTEQALTPESAPVAASPIEVAPMKEDALSKEEALAEAAPATATKPDQIVVVRGDTLTKIAAQIKPPDVSLERMLASLYRENAAVFDGHNMNRIRAGKILNIPSNEAVHALPQADAEEEIRAQAADWNVYRQKLAAARTARAETEAKQEAAGKITTAVTDKATSSKEPAKEVLKLSKGEAPNDKAVGGGKSSTQEQVVAKEEEDIAKGKALKEAEKRTAILEKNVQDMKRLAELKNEVAQASAPAAAVPVAAVEPSAASAPQAASSVASAKPKVKPQVMLPKVVEQPSLIDQILEEPLYMVGVAAALLALGGLGFVVARRGKQGGGKKKPSSRKEGEDSATGRMTAPIAPSPDTGDFTRAQVSTTQTAAPTNVDSEEVDPIGEADLFLTFGRDAQAEEVLKEALKKNPNNIPVKLKLLSIYSARKDTNSFYSYAREIRESGDKSAWDQAVAMGRELDPSNPYYGGDTSGLAAAGGKSEATSAPAPAVDFDLGFGSSTPAATAPAFASQNTVALESTSAQEKTAIISPEELNSVTQAGAMDFDITGTNPGMTPVGDNQEEATVAMNMDDLVFDVTATHPHVMSSSASSTAAVDDSSMTFTLDFPIEDKPAASAPARNLGLDEITLNLDKTGTSPVSGVSEQKDERWQEVATKLDLAKAYQEMGDAAGAREILEEVLRDGDEEQRGAAQTLMQQL